MDKLNIIKSVTAGVAGIISGVAAWLFAKIGILFYVIVALSVAMIIDYITGMLASKSESIDHLNNPEYGWSSEKGVKGILKKVGYLCVIAAAMMVDYIIQCVAVEIGLEIEVKAFFGILIAVWYLLNEALSIVENAGRMGVPIPDWFKQYIAVLKNKIEQKEEGS